MKNTSWSVLCIIVVACLYILVQTDGVLLPNTCPDGSSNFLFNGDFEINGTAASYFPNGTSNNPGALTIPGWTVTNGSTEIDFGPFTWTPYSGNWSSDLSGQSPGSMYQIVTGFSATSGVVFFSLGGNFYNAPTVKTGTVAVYALCSSNDVISTWTQVAFLAFSFDTSSSSASNMNWALLNLTFPTYNDTTTYAIQFTSTSNTGNGPVIDYVRVCSSNIVSPPAAKGCSRTSPDTCPDGSTSLIFNGDFEINATAASYYPNGTSNNPSATMIPGWTVTNGSTELDFGPFTWTPYSGNWSSDLSGQSGGSMYQTITNFQGRSGNIFFALGGNFYDAPTVKTGTVAVYALCSPNDAISTWTRVAFLAFSFDVSNSSPSNMNWALLNLTFPALSNVRTYAVQFTSTTNSGNGPVIDYVRVCSSNTVLSTAVTKTCTLPDTCPDNSPNVLFNGDFETNATFASFYPIGSSNNPTGLRIPGWTVTNGSTEVDFGPNTWTPYSGNWSSDLSGQSPGSMYQIVNFSAASGVVFFSLGGNFYDAPTIKTGTVAVYALCSPNDAISTWVRIAFLALSFDVSSSSASNMNWALTNLTFPTYNDTTTYAIQFTSTTNSGNGPVIDYVRVCSSNAALPRLSRGCPSPTPSISRSTSISLTRTATPTITITPTRTVSATPSISTSISVSSIPSVTSNPSLTSTQSTPPTSTDDSFSSVGTTGASSTLSSSVYQVALTLARFMISN